MDIAIMLEGQMGLNWARFKRIAGAVEDLGFAGLYRSDHFTNPNGEPDDSLELWVSLTWLASHTQRIDFGPMVSPVSFRDPVFTARMGMQIDDLSNGRLALGIGAGWQDREHTMFGYQLLDINERFARFEEGLDVISRLIESNNPVNYAGNYYQLKDAILLPRPQRKTPILIGGNGRRRTLPLVAHYADEWNAVYVTPGTVIDLNDHLDDLLDKKGRSRDSVRRSMMTGLAFGKDEADFKAQHGERDRDKMRHAGMIFGTPSEVQEQLAQLREETPLQRVMLQWIDLDNVDGLEAFAKAVL